MPPSKPKARLACRTNPDPMPHRCCLTAVPRRKKILLLACCAHPDPILRQVLPDSCSEKEQDAALARNAALAANSLHVLPRFRAKREQL